MNIKYFTFVLFALSTSANGIAQSMPDNVQKDKTSPAPAFEFNEIKHGPLADFYELVAQYQFVKKEPMKYAQEPVMNLSKTNQELIAEAKQPATRKPSAN